MTPRKKDRNKIPNPDTVSPETVTSIVEEDGSTCSEAVEGCPKSGVFKDNKKK